MSDAEEKFPQERRRVPRVGGSIVEYSVDGKDSGLKKAFIKDICIYGICIYVPETFDNGVVLDLSIYLFGNEKPINPKGKIVWQKPGGFLGYYNVGVEFTEISEECTKVLEDHIKINLKSKNEDQEEDDSKWSVLEE